LSVTFTKLLSSITASTVWCEPDTTRICWITMLAMADRKGRVFGSIPGLANIARIPTEACREAIRAFLAPDPDSRTKDYDGRRIEEIEGGWRLLNYEKHRSMIDEESVKESKRKYINARRAAEREAASYPQAGGAPAVDTNVYSRRSSTQAEAEAEAERSKDNPPTPLKGGASVENFEAFWAQWPAHKRKVAKQQCLAKWKTLRCDESIGRIMDALHSAKSSSDWTKEGGEYIPAPIVWLNQRRWEAPTTENQAQTPSLTVPGESTEAYLARVAREREERARGCVKPPADILALVRRAVRPVAP